MTRRLFVRTAAAMAVVVAGHGWHDRARVASAAPQRVIEAETAVADTPLCGDDGPMRAVDDAEASGGRSLFVPGSGCRFSLAGDGVATVTAVRLRPTGAPGLLCGRFEFRGGLVGASEPACTPGSTWLVAPVTTNERLGSFTVTWRAADETPTYVNVFIDYFAGH